MIPKYLYDRDDFIIKMKRHIREWHVIHENDTPDREIIDALEDCWPLTGQVVSYTIEDYVEHIRSKLKCTPVHLRKWGEIDGTKWRDTYRFSLTNSKWYISICPECELLSEEDETEDDRKIRETTICLNGSVFLDVGTPELTVEMLSELDILWPSFKEYLADLKRKRRKRQPTIPALDINPHIKHKAQTPRKRNVDAITHHLEYNLNPNSFFGPNPRITVELLGRKYHEYNEAYFNGLLPACPIEINSLNKSCAALYSGSSIVLSFETTYCYDAYLRAVILHEMIHHYIKCFHPDFADGSHGRLFCYIRKQLNSISRLRIDQLCTEEDLNYDIIKQEEVNEKVREEYQLFWADMQR